MKHINISCSNSRLKLIVFIVIIILLALPIFSWAWWRDKEKGIIILEKGDSLWKVAHSLYGGGWNYPLLWNNRLDSVSINPNIVYAGMRFRDIEAEIKYQDESNKNKLLEKAVAVEEEMAKSIHHISNKVDSIHSLSNSINEGINPGFGSSVVSSTIPSLLTELIVALICALSFKFGLYSFLKNKGWV